MAKATSLGVTLRRGAPRGAEGSAVFLTISKRSALSALAYSLLKYSDARRNSSFRHFREKVSRYLDTTFDSVIPLERRWATTSL